MSDANYPLELIEARGEAWYQQLRSQVEPGNHDKFFVVDIETGDYEIDDDDAEASERLLAKRPNCITYGLRIGDPIAYRLGGHVADFS